MINQYDAEKHGDTCIYGEQHDTNRRTVRTRMQRRSFPSNSETSFRYADMLAKVSVICSIQMVDILRLRPQNPVLKTTVS